MTAMIPYHRYRVWYKLDGQRMIRSFVGVYLGPNIYGQEDFSLRPLLGTSSIPKESIEAFRITEASATQPVKVQGPPSLAENESTGYQLGPTT